LCLFRHTSMNISAMNRCHRLGTASQKMCCTQSLAHTPARMRMRSAFASQQPAVGCLPANQTSLQGEPIATTSHPPRISNRSILSSSPQAHSTFLASFSLFLLTNAPDASAAVQTFEPINPFSGVTAPGQYVTLALFLMTVPGAMYVHMYACVCVCVRACV